MNQTNVILFFMLLAMISAISFWDRSQVDTKGGVVVTAGASNPAQREVKTIGVSRYDRASADLQRRIMDPAYDLEKPYYQDALTQIYWLGGAVEDKKISTETADEAIVTLDRLMRDGFFSDEDMRDWGIYVSSLLAAH
jgi:hypothetical protein